MPQLRVRWSEHEARKPYARPFGVSFVGDDGSDAGAVAVSGSELLYYREFQGAVLTLTGELFRHPAVESAADPQRGWLGVVASMLPPLAIDRCTVVSHFDDQHGRLHRIAPLADAPHVTVDALRALEYQEFQAALAHQTGRLYRRDDVESIDDPGRRQLAWVRVLANLIERDVTAPAWPFS